MLTVGEYSEWRDTTREDDDRGVLFRPYVTMPTEGGMKRSWLPSDLPDDAGPRLREFAAASANPFVRARVYEVLWDRFRKFDDVAQAIAARIEGAPLRDAEHDWPGLVGSLGRLATLVVRLNRMDRAPQLFAALDDAADQLPRTSRPFAFISLANMVSRVVLPNARWRQLFTADRAARWAESLSSLADKHLGDPHHGHDALDVLQAWWTRMGHAELAAAARRRLVANLREAARRVEPAIAPSHLQRALKCSVDFGLGDLIEPLRKELMLSIQSAVPEFKEHSVRLTLPSELLGVVDGILNSTPELGSAIRQLSVLPGMLEVDLEHLRKAAAEQLKGMAFLGRVPSTHFHPDGKVTSQSDDLEGNLERHVGLLIGSHLALTEFLLLHVLRQIHARFEPTTLLDALARWPHLAEHRRDLLALASERFAAQDWVSSGFITMLVLEAVLRDLLRAGGYSALKLEPGGVQMDETLGSLLSNRIARAALGDGYCDLANYVFCDPALGWNLRNEIAHGTIRPDNLPPARVFLAWLFLIRVTCLVAAPPRPEPPRARESDGESESESEAESEAESEGESENKSE